MSAFRTVLVFTILALLGVLLAPKLSLHYTPAPISSAFTVSYQMYGASPLIIEQKITSVLENELSQIDGIQKLYSRSGYGSGYLTLTFDANEDLAFKKIEIISLLRGIQKELPPEVGFPQVSLQTDEDENDSPLLIYAIYADMATSDIQQVIDQQMIARLSTVKGVQQVDLSGTSTKTLVVNYHQEQLDRLDISAREIVQALQSQTSFSFQYSIRDGQLELPVLIGAEKKLDELQSIPFGKELQLGDICQIIMQDREEERIHRINGKKAILLSIMAAEAVNRIEVADEVEQVVASISPQLPSSINVRKRYDDTTFLKEELHKASYRTIFSIIILCGFILLFTLRWKQLVILFSGILINVGLVLLLAYLFELEIHLYTIAGLTVSFGLLIDNAIVMLDHLTKYRNKQILTGLLAASLTTVAALAVVFFLPAEDRQNLSDFALIVILSLSCSLLVAWLFTPSLLELVGARVSKSSSGKSKRTIKVYQFYDRLVIWLASKRGWLITALILAFGLPVYLLPTKIEGQEWYNETYGNDYYQEEIRPYVDRVLGGASRLFYRNVFEGGGFREPGKTRLYVRASLPYGHSIEQMDFTLQKVEKYLATVSGLDVFLSYVYSGTSGQIVIEFEEKEEKGGLPYILKNRLTSKALDWGGVDWSIYGVGRGFSNQSGEQLPSFRVQMKGYQFDKLEEMAGVFAEKLLQHKRIQEVNINEHLSWNSKDLKELRFQYQDHWSAIPTVDIHRAFQSASEQSYRSAAAGYASLSNERMPVYLDPERATTFSPYKLLNYNFDEVKLGLIGHLKEETGNPQIHKQDRQYLRMVGFDYFGSHRFGQKYLEEVMEEMKPILPPGFSMESSRYSWFGEKEKRQYSLIIVLIIAIYLICVVFFEDFKKPLLIVFIIPLSFIGLFLIFAWGGFYFDQGGYAAFLMLGGLVVNAAIFIFSDYNQQKGRIQSRNVTKAVFQKAWPITLTVVSTCVGLIPFLINGDQEVFWFSLAIGMIGGLAFSTLLVLIVLPAMMVQRKRT